MGEQWLLTSSSENSRRRFFVWANKGRDQSATSLEWRSEGEGKQKIGPERYAHRSGRPGRFNRK